MLSQKKYPIGSPGGMISLPKLVSPGETADSIQEKCARLKSRLLAVMGCAPSEIPLIWNTVSTQTLEGIQADTIAIQSYGGDWLRALLLRPREASDAKLPAVLALHPTDPLYSRALVERRVSSDEDYPYALELAQAGFFVLAPDIFTSAHYPEAKSIEDAYRTDRLSEQFPGWSAVGRMYADHRLALTLLCSLPHVDENRVGVIGHSLGGTNALVLTALDERIRASALSCCFTSFCCHPNIRVWCRNKGFCYFPALRETIDQGYVPFEWYELLAAAAPRPCFIHQTKNDIWFQRWDSTQLGVDRARAVYGLYNAEDRLHLHLWEGPHSFLRPARQEVCTFLKSVL